MAIPELINPFTMALISIGRAIKLRVAPTICKENYKWMIIGGVVIALGMFLMSGGKNENPNQFNYNLVYSTTRVTIAPITIIAGLIIEIFAILKKPNVKA